MKALRKITVFYLIATILLSTGCATHFNKFSPTPQPASAELGSYEKVFMKNVAINNKLSRSSANTKAMRKIDEVMHSNMQMVFPSYERLTLESNTDNTAKRTLIIEPRIKEIKFIGNTARFWIGSIAGNSTILLQTKFIDGETGDVIGSPEFYRSSEAYTGTWSIDDADNKMLEEIAKDVVTYASFNR